MRPSSFKDYTLGEAQAVARDFVAAAMKMNAAASTEDWTEWVLDWFAQTAPAGLCVDARPSRRHGDLERGSPPARQTAGEFLVDLSHSTFPRYDQHAWGTEAYWEKAYETPPLLKLALESEMGVSRSEPATTHKVMEDAAKLFVLQARIKVMVFASTSVGNRGTIVSLADSMATCDPSRPECWLWIDLPWGARTSPERAPWWRTFPRQTPG